MAASEEDKKATIRGSGCACVVDGGRFVEGQGGERTEG